MSNKKGFTLIELIVVMVITGILVAVAIPSYSNYMEQGAAGSAGNTLMVIANGQHNYYLNNGNYYCSPGVPCPGSTPAPSANDFTGINAALSANIPANNFQYSCSNSGGTGGFICIAWDGTDMVAYTSWKMPTPESCCSASNHNTCPSNLTCQGYAAPYQY